MSAASGHNGSMLRRGVVLLAWLLALAWHSAVLAQDNKAEARKLGTEAGQLLDTKRYAEALERVEQAEALYHAPTHLQMKGEALEGLGRLAEALAVYRQLMAEPLADGAAAAFVRAQQFARERARELSGRVPTLEVRVAGAPAHAVEATVDGRPIAVGGGEGVRVDTGSHTVVVTADGFESVEREITLLEGDAGLLDIELEPSGAAASEDEGDEDTADAAPGIYLPPWIAFGVGGAGLLVGTITGVLSISKVGDLDEKCPDYRCTPAEQSLIDEAGTLGNVSTVGFVIGGVGVAAGVVLLLWRPGADAEDEDDGDAEIAAVVNVAPWFGPGAFGVKGRF